MRPDALPLLLSEGASTASFEIGAHRGLSEVNSTSLRRGRTPGADVVHPHLTKPPKSTKAGPAEYNFKVTPIIHYVFDQDPRRQEPQVINPIDPASTAFLKLTLEPRRFHRIL